MMNVKKYRAETTREALEQIKMDLGEDAFVLETKQVRSGGFLGVGAKMEVEISATPSLAGAPAAEKKTGGAAFSKNSILNLTDDAPAMPQAAAPKIETVELMNALKNRAESVDQFENVFPGASPFAADKFTAAPKEFEAVEISTETPRLIHRKKERKETTERQAPVACGDAGAKHGDLVTVSSQELELLRAELREVKFSISSFAQRPAAQVWNKNSEIDVFSEVFDLPFSKAYTELTTLGIAPGIAHNLVAEVIPQYKKGSVPLNEITQTSLRQAIVSLIKFGADPLKKEGKNILAMIGATGVGKTTTIAKLAARLALRENRRVELVTLDTYRIAAVEQLKTYAELIGAGCNVVRSVLELDAVLRRMPEDAAILIDTTGRNPLDLADQYEFSDYLRSRRDVSKCLAVQSTTHPQDAIAAIKKFEMYGADCLALTKLDETTRPGSMLEVLAESALPLTYMCAGQRVPEDLKAATPANLIARIFDNRI